MAPWNAFWFGSPQSRKLPRCRFARPGVEALEQRLQPVVSLTPNQAFVNEVYQDLLRRDAEPVGLGGWSSALDQGATRAQVVADIETSLEYRTDALGDIYNHYLGRSVDSSGLNFGLTVLADGGTLLQLEAFVAGSPEYFVRNGNTADGFLNAVYRDGLGRGIDPIGQAAWGSALNRGVSPAEISPLILNSPESLAHHVEGLYLRFLHRPADVPGRDAWVALAGQTGGLEAVIAGILGSPEYFQVAQRTPTTTTLTASSAASAAGETVTFTAVVTPTAPDTATLSGTVDFQEAGTTLATVALDSTGQATFSTATLSVGSHSLTAVYSGDNNFVSSTSAALTHRVDLKATTTTLTASANPLTRGDTVTFTAVVSPNTSGPLTAGGNVVFQDGGTALATVPLGNNGQATLTTGALTAGTHAITAVYQGDSSFAGSTSNGISQVVNLQATTTTLLPSSLNPATRGDAVTFTAVVSPNTSGSATAGGTVAFQDGSTTLGTVNLDNKGQAVFTTAVLTTGSHTITAVYSGDTNFAGSTSPGLTQSVVRKMTMITTPDSSENPAAPSDTVTFTAVVSPHTAGSAIATGTVTFKDNGATLMAVPLDANGQAVFTTSLSLGTHPITAVYSGDTNFTDNTSTTLPQVIQFLPGTSTTTTVSAQPATIQAGEQSVLTATVVAKATGLPVTGSSTETVTFKDVTDNNKSLGMGTPIGNGKWTLTIHAPADLAAGQTYTIMASFNDTSSTFNPSSGETMLTVNTVATQVSVTPPNSSVQAGTQVALTASVSPHTSGALTAGGTVNFFRDVVDSAHQLNSMPIPLDSSGNAPFTTAPADLTGGMHTIFAVYSGDSNFAGNTGTASVTVTKVTLTPTPLTVTQSDNELTPVLAAPDPLAGGQAATGRVNLRATVTAPVGLKFMDSQVTFTVKDSGGNVVFSMSESLTGSGKVTVTTLTGFLDPTVGTGVNATAAQYTFVASYSPGSMDSQYFNPGPDSGQVTFHYMELDGASDDSELSDNERITVNGIKHFDGLDDFFGS